MKAEEMYSKILVEELASFKFPSILASGWAASVKGRLPLFLTGPDTSTVLRVDYECLLCTQT